MVFTVQFSNCLIKQKDCYIYRQVILPRYLRTMIQFQEYSWVEDREYGYKYWLGGLERLMSFGYMTEYGRPMTMDFNLNACL